MRRLHRLGFLCLLIVCSVGCRSPYYGDRGAAFGGLTGAGVGAVIGSQDGNAAEGALLGGALGALSGGVVGNALDDIEARNQQRAANPMRQAASGATIGDVVEMSQSGLSDDVIVQHLRTQGFSSALNANDLIYLKNRGTSDQVIRAMQDLAANPIPVRAVAPASYVVEEHHYGPVHPRHYFRRRPCPPYRGPRVGWHIGVHH